MAPNPKPPLLPSLLLLFFCISAVASGQAQPTFSNGYGQAQPVQGQSLSQRAFALAAYLREIRTEYSNAGGATADADCFTRVGDTYKFLGQSLSINNVPRIDISSLRSATASCLQNVYDLANNNLVPKLVDTYLTNADQLLADLKGVIRP